MSRSMNLYLPQAFARPDDHASVLALIDSAPFATWVHVASAETHINHLPIARFDDDQSGHGPSTQGAPSAPSVLWGHVARANPAWQFLEGASCSRLIFHGPHHYISPSWYPSKAEHHKAVPTWNYAVVHVHVTPRVVEDPAMCRRVLAELTRRNESTVGSSWSIDDAPPDFIDALMRAIVVIEYRVDAVEAKWKLSQNRPTADQQGVLDALDRLGGQGDAQAAALSAWSQRLRGGAGPAG